MSKVSANEIKEFIINHLSEKMDTSGLVIDANIPDNYDLYMAGVIDSFGLLTLTVALEEHFGKEIDFEGLDAEQMTVIGPLSNYIEKILN